MIHPQKQWLGTYLAVSNLTRVKTYQLRESIEGKVSLHHSITM